MDLDTTQRSIEHILEDAMQVVPPYMRDLPSRISHGIRTPLTSIVGFEEILKKDETLAEAERAEFQAIIAEEKARLDRFITGLQTFEKIKKHTLSPDRSFHDIGATVRAAVESFAWGATRRGVSLDMKVPEMPVGIVVDHGQIRFATELLIANALSVTRNGGKIAVVAKKIAGGVSISVEDTGCGICRYDLPFIFAPFTRVQHPDDSGSELGLGLTVARQIVTLHGGKIDAASIPERGSRFRILLPA